MSKSLKIGQLVSANSLVPRLESLENYFLFSQIEFEIINLSVDEFSEQMNTGNFSYDFVRISFDHCQTHFNLFPIVPQIVKFSLLFDTIQNENKIILPRLHYFQILKSFFVHKFKNHDIRNYAAIICKNYELNGFISFVVSLGHSRIIVIDHSPEEAQVDKINKHFPGVEIRFVSNQELTQVNFDTSLMINSIDLEKNNHLLSNLAYFNFMKKNGVVGDLFSKTPIHPFLFEAEKAGLKIFSRNDFVKYYEFELLYSLDIVKRAQSDDFLNNYVEIN